METLTEILINTLYFSLNPVAWAIAINYSIRHRKLRKPAIAAVLTQLFFSVLLVSMNFLANDPMPIADLIVMVILPGLFSGLLVAALVITLTKPRQMVRRVSARLQGSAA